MRFVRATIIATMVCVFGVVSVWGADFEAGHEQGGEAMADYWPAVTVPRTRIALSSKLNENVITVQVEEGEQVNEGDVLLQFDAQRIKARIRMARVETDYEARIKRQKRQLEHAEREYKRSASLAEGEGMITGSELDEDLTRMKIAELQLEELKREKVVAERKLELYEAEREAYTIKAPTDGVVSQIWIEKGEMAQQGEKLMELISPDTLEVRLHLPETLIGNIRRGQGGVLRFSCVGGYELPATVSFVSPYVDSSSGTFVVKMIAKDDSNRVKPGMGCDVRFQRRETKKDDSSE